MSLQAKSASLASEEKQLLAVKYQEPAISRISTDDLIKHTKGLLFKIHVITGWNLPDDDYYMNVLKDQLFKKLSEDYTDCSVAEIEFAFRNYGTTVKDWGKNMNLQLFDTVMSAYKTARACISGYEERIVNALPESKPSEEQVLNMRRSLIEDWYQSFLQKKARVVLFPEDGIDTLVNDKFCYEGIHNEFISQARERLVTSYNSQIDNAKLSGKAKQATELTARLDAIIADEAFVEVQLYARKLSLLYCFYRFKKAGYTNIYTRVEE
jgi:hypothetical protein